MGGARPVRGRAPGKGQARGQTHAEPFHTEAEPADLLPRVLDTPELFAAGAKVLAEGRGPFAVDTERASGFRYDDRVFLLQVRRRGAGTLLFAPEGRREKLTAALAPVMTGADWIVHAAVTDLPPLAWLGLVPGRLFDTELAGRLLGYDRVNLGALLESTLGVHLDKGHGQEDWSTTPLPEDWLVYAEGDVAYLLELADFLAEALDNEGKLGWAGEDFDHIIATHTDPAPERDWKKTKGLRRLRRPRQLAVARALWQTREDLAVAEDKNPAILLPDKALVAFAAAGVSDADRLLNTARLKPTQYRRVASRISLWARTAAEALASDPADWPRPAPRHDSIPPHSHWPEHHPQAAEAWEKIQENLLELSVELGMPVENIAAPKVLRRAVWESTEGHQLHSVSELVDFLVDYGVRDWQIELVVPAFTAAVFTADRGRRRGW